MPHTGHPGHGLKNFGYPRQECGLSHSRQAPGRSSHDVRESSCHVRSRPVASAGNGIRVFQVYPPAFCTFPGGILKTARNR